jgi:hypothetical protein
LARAIFKSIFVSRFILFLLYDAGIRADARPAVRGARPYASTARTVVDTPGPTSPTAIHFMQQKVGYMNIKNIPLQKICHTYPR